MPRALKWSRLKTAGLSHHLCLKEITKPRAVWNGDNLRWSEMCAELLMPLMDSFFFISGARQLKACQEEFPPQLILRLVVHTITFQNVRLRVSRRRWSFRGRVCPVETSSGRVLPPVGRGRGLWARRISGQYYEKQYYHKVHLMIGSL